MKNEEAARLRAEAKRFREHAKAARVAVANAPNQLAKIQAQARVVEYVRAAQSRDRAALAVNP